MDYNFAIKYPYRGYHYVLQNVVILQAVQLTLYTMDNFIPFMGDAAPNVYGHTITASACRLLVWVLTLSSRSVN